MPTDAGLPRIDVHLHLAGTGCCASGCSVAPALRSRLTFRALRLIHRISDHALATSFDADWPAKMLATLKGAGFNYGVALGFDGVYARDSGQRIDADTQMIVPPAWVFQVARDYPGLLPGPSINPYRADALKLLEWSIDQGAVLIKWLPPAQAIDPDDARIQEFYRIMAAARVPLLIHVGRERTFRTITNDYNAVERLRRPLEAGVTVIAAHSATRVLGTGEADQTAALKTMLRTYPHLWVDNSGLCNPSRWSHLPRLAADPEITARTLYGSDWPVPANAFYYVGRLPLRSIAAMERLPNPIARDLALKQAFGYPEATLTRANSVLANLHRWVAGAPGAT